MTLASNEFDCDVAIIGAGPVGALLANLLGAAGLTVIAFDREQEIVRTPRAVGIDGEIMRAFQLIGLADELEPRLKVFRGAQYLDVKGEVVATRPPVTGEGPQGWPNRYNVHQPDLEEVLRNGIAARTNVDLRLGHEVVAFEQDAHSATVTARQADTDELVTVRARFAIGCDGGKSTARGFAGSTLDDYGLNEPWIVADFKVRESAELPDINTHFADPLQPVIYIHVVRDLRRFEFKALPGEDLSRAEQPEYIWGLVERWLAPADAELVRAAVYTHRSLVARKWRDGRLFLAGDAAHQTPPFLGQGLCTGVRDVVSLTWRMKEIVQSGAPLAILDSYENERSQHARFFIRTATSLGPVLTSPDKSKIAELNARVGREGSGTPPRLGDGLFRSDAVGGTLAPQPRLGDGTLLDQAVGLRFGVLVTPEIATELADGFADDIASAGMTLVVASGGAQTVLDSIQSVAAIIRPDRYYYGAFADTGDLVGAVEDLRGKLRTGIPREAINA